MVALDFFDPPEINGVTWEEMIRHASPTPHARPAKQQIQQSANSPEPISVVPACLTPQPFDWTKGYGRRKRHTCRPRVHNTAPECNSAPLRGSCNRRERIGPARFGKLPIFIGERPLQCFTKAEWVNGE